VLRVDETAFGRYRLIKLLGRGGMGEVWLAHDTGIDRDVALKMLLPHFAQDHEFEQRFRREARAAARLDDPHVVPIYDVGELDGRLYVTMRPVKGGDLQSVLKDGPLDPERAVKIVEQVASALNAAHKAGLVHRDVKPSNVLLTEDDFAYLIDFGIARAAGETGLTSTGATIGTWSYMAPERFKDGVIAPSSDVYALACVLYQCLTGELPFTANTLEQVAVAHMVSPAPRPSLTHPGVPTDLDAVIAEGMAKDPTLRYQTTVELATAARTALRNAPPTEPTVPARRPREAAPAPSESAAPPGDWPTVASGSAAAHALMADPTEPTQRRPDARTPRNKKKVVWAAIAAAVAVIAVAGLVVALNSRDTGARTPSQGPAGPAGAAGPGSGSPAASGPAPNTGPFTGTFTVDFGPMTKLDGGPVPGAPPPFKETWRLRSVCGAAGCVATAMTGGGLPVPNLVFDDVGGRWLAVTTSAGAAHQDKDSPKCNGQGEWFEVLSLQPRPDGSISGEWIAQNQSLICYHKRTLNFTRTGDTDLSALPDPAVLPARVVSPAEALHGTYHFAFSGIITTEPFDYSVQTECLRTGDRCISYFYYIPGSRADPYVFENSQWTQSSESSVDCSSGGSFRISTASTLALPQPAQDPISRLTGHGRRDNLTATSCPSGDYNITVIRTGN
jgi:predicted Ser/Thr protein kinase